MDTAVEEILTDVDRLLPLREVVTASGLSRSTIYAWMDDGRFPLPLRVGGRRLWRRSEIAAWIDAQPRYQPTQVRAQEAAG